MAGSVPFYKPRNLDGKDFNAWKESVIEMLEAGDLLDLIDPQAERIKLDEFGSPHYSVDKKRLRKDLRAQDIILRRLEPSAEAEVPRITALHVWCTLNLRYGEGKAAQAKALMVEYYNVLCNADGETIEKDPDEESDMWQRANKVIKMFPLAWFVDDDGLERLIISIETMLHLYKQNPEKGSSHDGQEECDERFAEMLKSLQPPSKKRSKR